MQPQDKRMEAKHSICGKSATTNCQTQLNFLDFNTFFSATNIDILVKPLHITKELPNRLATSRPINCCQLKSRDRMADEAEEAPAAEEDRDGMEVEKQVIVIFTIMPYIALDV
jgi:hypothetical protein